MADNTIVSRRVGVIGDLVFCLEFISGSCVDLIGAKLLLVHVDKQ